MSYFSIRPIRHNVFGAIDFWKHRRPTFHRPLQQLTQVCRHMSKELALKPSLIFVESFGEVSNQPAPVHQTALDFEGHPVLVPSPRTLAIGEIAAL
jgi:hypothetical protein